MVDCTGRRRSDSPLIVEYESRRLADVSGKGKTFAHQGQIAFQLFRLQGGKRVDSAAARISWIWFCNCLHTVQSPSDTHWLIQGERMRRLIYLLLLAVFVSASVSRVNASTDCERWFVAYRQELAHSRHLQRIAAARRRARLYAQRKLAGLVRTAAKPRPSVSAHPRMTRKQTLRHFDVACGVLPEPEEAVTKVAEEIPAEFSAAPPSRESLDLLPADRGDLLAENTAPLQPFESGSQDTRSAADPPMGAAFAGGAGGGGGYVPAGSGTVAPPSRTPAPSTGGASGPPPGMPSAPASDLPPTPPAGPPSAPPPAGTPSQFVSQSPTLQPPAVVPEPASYILLLTGLAGAAGAIRRRLQA